MFQSIVVVNIMQIFVCMLQTFKILYLMNFIYQDSTSVATITPPTENECTGLVFWSVLSNVEIQLQVEVFYFVCHLERLKIYMIGELVIVQCGILYLVFSFSHRTLYVEKNLQDVFTIIIQNRLPSRTWSVGTTSS